MINVASEEVPGFHKTELFVQDITTLREIRCCGAAIQQQLKIFTILFKNVHKQRCKFIKNQYFDWYNLWNVTIYYKEIVIFRLIC